MKTNSLNSSDNNSPKAGGLVLWRKNGETIQIGKDIYITILSHNEHSGSKVRVSAPRNKRIKRIDEIPGSYNFDS